MLAVQVWMCIRYRDEADIDLMWVSMGMDMVWCGYSYDINMDRVWI